MARLYNTGNYEHVRFEVSAEVPPGGSARQTFLDLGAILGRMRPIRRPHELETARATLNKLREELTEVEKSNLERYAELVKEYEGEMALRKLAIERLDDLGGSSKTGGGPSDSYDDDTPW